MVWVDAFDEGDHHVDPRRDGVLAAGAAGLVHEVPGEDGGVVLVDAAVHCPRKRNYKDRSFTYGAFSDAYVPDTAVAKTWDY